VFLRDETGGRRFWPTTVGEIDLDLLKEKRDQLFAEAVIRYCRGERWWPSAEFEREHISHQQEERYEADEWEGPINEYLSKLEKKKTTIMSVAEHALRLEVAKLGTAEQRRISTAMERAGWRRGKRDAFARWWVPGPGKTPSAAPTELKVVHRGSI
jgi:predicted P-loop ATPase